VYDPADPFGKMFFNIRLLGLLCGRVRRKYVTNLSLQAMSTASLLIPELPWWHGGR